GSRSRSSAPAPSLPTRASWPRRLPRSSRRSGTSSPGSTPSCKRCECPRRGLAGLVSRRRRALSQLARAVRHALRLGPNAAAADLVNRSLPEDDHVTQFEALTAAAYWELARREVEVAVIEAGLGGRYDATNVIPSKVQALTTVGLEHTRWLGPTITHIAGEKL